ncbi:hypothetical protein FB45DRAFT_868299 [Roridomyces roridus]|uniref:Uncharacterized protein n=1 Tax=Roridomyces roridus TaxID=1738132 RepID=A0AAD7BPJ3_9AGAR|nr:hypothetical protein FB45DRAFT_868299 [Roridomyces roridus]
MKEGRSFSWSSVGSGERLRDSVRKARVTAAMPPASKNAQHGVAEIAVQKNGAGVDPIVLPAVFKLPNRQLREEFDAARVFNHTFAECRCCETYAEDSSTSIDVLRQHVKPMGTGSVGVIEMLRPFDDAGQASEDRASLSSVVRVQDRLHRTQCLQRQVSAGCMVYVAGERRRGTRAPSPREDERGTCRPLRAQWCRERLPIRSQEHWGLRNSEDLWRYAAVMY